MQHRITLAVVLTVTPLLVLACDPNAFPGGIDVGGTPCSTSIECDDGLFCNGEELCLFDRCTGTGPRVCDDGIDCTIDQCSEIRASCLHEAPDADGDGYGDQDCVDANGRPLGVDCDDANNHTYPGATEVCDAGNVDEDCDPTTYGSVDADGDGFDAAGCCNDDGQGVLSCGTDCDDTNHAIVPGSQVCSDHEEGLVQICQVDGAYEEEKCLFDDICRPQPNGLGICVPHDLPPQP